MAIKKFDNVRNDIMKKLSSFLENDYEILITGTNEFCIPIVNEEGEENYLVMTFKIPTGSRDGEPYDGYSVAEDFRLKQKLKEEKAKENAEKKAKKIARDKEIREAKMKAKKECV